MADSFVVQHKLNDKYNQRLFIIHGNKEIDGKNLDGKLDIVSNKEKDFNYLHIQYVKYYLSNLYLTDKQMQKIANTMSTISDFLQLSIFKYNDLVIADTSSLKPKSKNVIISLPNEMSEKQFKTFANILDYFKDYKNVLVTGRYSIGADGYLDCDYYKNLSGKSAFAILDEANEVLVCSGKQR